MGFIYVICNNVNDLVYIGQTTWKPQKRWNSHKSKARMIIEHRNGKRLNEKYKSILTSALYNAMADYGIDKFMFEILEYEIAKEQLNDVEKYYVTQFNCRSPNGYNLTNGGGSKYEHAPASIELMKKVKHERINQVRHPILHDMPPYFTYEKSLDAIILQNHTLCDFKGFYVRTHGSIEKAKEEALKFLQGLEKSGVKYAKEKKLKNSPYKGVYEIPEGSGTYYVTKQYKNKTYRRSFSTNTPEENMHEAIEFAKDPIKYDNNHK